MEFIKTEIPDVILIKPTEIEDHRGFFLEYYHRKKFMQNQIDINFVQDNHAKSIKNTLRGLHYQIKYPQAKLIRCIKGKIFDVAVDIRKGSQSYSKWVGRELSENNKLQMYIPEGFAHGYYVVSDVAEVTYKCSNIYYSQYDKGIRWNDTDIGIHWPMKNPIISNKDKSLPFLKDIK